MKRLMVKFILIANVCVAQIQPETMNWYNKIAYRPPASTANTNIGYALHFPAVSTPRVYLPTTSSFQNSSNVTVSAWVKMLNYSNFSFIFHESAGNGNGRLGFGFEQTTGKMRTFWRDKNNEAGSSTVILSPSAIVLSNWVHVCYTWSSATDTHQFYTNGILVSNVASSVDELGSGNPVATTIGALSGEVGTYSLPIIGSIDEVTAWKRVLASNEVYELYNSGTGTYITNTGAFASSGILYTNSARWVFHFDENTGTNVTDYSGNNYNGSAGNTTWTNGIVTLP